MQSHFSLEQQNGQGMHCLAATDSFNAKTVSPRQVKKDMHCVSYEPIPYD